MCMQIHYLTCHNQRKRIGARGRFIHLFKNTIPCHERESRDIVFPKMVQISFLGHTAHTPNAGYTSGFALSLNRNGTYLRRRINVFEAILATAIETCTVGMIKDA